MWELKDLRSFLFDAGQNTWAAGNELAEKHEFNDSRTYKFEQGDWKYEDNYFGSNRTGGREVVYYKETPIWMKTYYGCVYDDEPGRVYGFLRKALVAKDKPTVDPYLSTNRFVDGDYKYVRHIDGSIDRFSGEEMVYKDGDEVYTSIYSGGLI